MVILAFSVLKMHLPDTVETCRFTWSEMVISWSTVPMLEWIPPVFKALQPKIGWFWHFQYWKCIFLIQWKLENWHESEWRLTEPPYQISSQCRWYLQCYSQKYSEFSINTVLNRNFPSAIILFFHGSMIECLPWCKIMVQSSCQILKASLGPTWLWGYF